MCVAPEKEPISKEDEAPIPTGEEAAVNSSSLFYSRVTSNSYVFVYSKQPKSSNRKFNVPYQTKQISLPS